MPQIQLTITGMHCASCVATVTKVSTETPGVRSCEVNYATGLARLEADLARFRAVELHRRLRQAGYGLATRRVTFSAEGLSDSPDALRIESKLGALAGVVSVQANAATHSVTVDFVDTVTPVQDIRGVVAGLGFKVGPFEEITERPSGTFGAKVAVSLLGAAVLMFAPMWVDMGVWAPALAAVVQFWCGWTFHWNFLRSALRRTANMDTLISIGTNVAFLYSAAVALHWVHDRHVYFETSATIIAFVLLGRWLEARARGKTSDALRMLAELAPKTATVLRDGQPQTVEAATLRVGDMVLVRPGDAVPCDGEVVEGTSSVNESMLTGESAPVDKSAGSKVFAGTVNESGALKVRVTKDPRQWAVSEIVRLVREAQGSKARIERLADRVAAVFVPTILGVALVTFLGWWPSGWERAMMFSIAVLIVACPCALGLATPTAVITAVGRASRSGILVKSAQALEALAEVDVVVFDKTGTLTEGKPRVLEASTPEALEYAASVEQFSAHPIAKAIAASGRARPVSDFRSEPGLGVRGRVDGREVVVGSADLMRFNGIEVDGDAGPREKGRTVVYVAVDGTLAGTIVVADAVKTEAAEVVRELRELGLKVAMLTGDHERTARAVASELGIEQVIAEVLPPDKAREVRRLQESGVRVAFVGDGINDAPSLVQADVGLALSTGTDIAVESADVVLIGGTLRKVKAAVVLARRTMRVIRQNLWWAFGYNMLLVPVAAGVFAGAGLTIHPMLAAAAMALSSVSVVANSLRLRHLQIS